MKSDQDIIYEAVRDAWLIRLREIDMSYPLRETLENLYDIYSANAAKSKASKSLAGMANTSDDDKPKSMADIVRPTGATVQEVRKTSFRRRRA